MSIQLFVPTFQVEECLAEIRECLEKGWTGLGFKTLEFEKAWCSYTGLPHSHFVASATAGLHLALSVLKGEFGWEDGDEVITSPITFVSTNHAILYERLKPVFADVDEYLCLSPENVLARITPRTRAVMFVGMGGNTGQLDRISAICREHQLLLIIDAAHMAGTRVRGETPRGDATIYSFQAVKTLPTADSGMVCFADPKHDEIARKLSWLGINKDTYARTASSGAYRWHYDVEYVGYKYNGNSIMAAIGLTQLRYLERDCAYRRQLCAWYDQYFAGDNRITRVPVPAECESARHLYQIQVNHREELMLALNESDIYPGVHYRDNREYQMYRSELDDCPNATQASNRVLSLPLHLRLSREDVKTVATAVKQYAQ